MKSILYLPLDERPCNLKFMPMLAAGTDYKVLLPPAEYMGHKKTPADIDGLWRWLYQSSGMADAAILSLDMLVYGGIVPSRLHSMPPEECKKRLENIREIYSANRSIKLYAFSLIMRCPSYSSSDEEPDYYEAYGRDIFKSGYLGHKIELGLGKEEEMRELEEIKKRLPADIITDYTRRRKVNLEINRLAVDLVGEGIIDFLAIPQDDSSPYGFTAKDQLGLRRYISERGLSTKIYMYPGADEAGMTLFSRLALNDRGARPNVYVRFSSVSGPSVIPLYEDRPLGESVKCHVLAAGGLVSDSLSDADLVLMVNSPPGKMLEAPAQDKRGPDYDVGRSLAEFTEYIDYIVNTRKMTCAVADVAYANGGDLELVNHLRQKSLLYRVSSYAGWNTSSNSLGTAIAQGLLSHTYGRSRPLLDFLGLRYLEDAGYCSHVRKYIAENRLEAMGLSYFKTDGQRGRVSSLVKEELHKFTERYLRDGDYRIDIKDVYMPWSRMFEVGLEVKVLPAGR